MKNFLRALRFCLPYRRRVLVSVICAAFAALFWSLSFTAIQPFLTVLEKQQSLQTWVDEQIEKTQLQINGDPEAKDPKQREGLQAKVNVWAERDRKLADGEQNDQTAKLRRDVTKELAKYEGELESARTAMSRYLIARKLIYQYLPTDPFQTLCCIVGLVVITVALKGLFEFCQDSLVGSAVNLAQFDLRNRFYRNVIHLDVDQFGEQGSSELMARFTNDMEMLATGVKTLFGKVVAEPLKAVGCVVLACLISWQLTLMFLVLVPIALLILTRVGRMMKRATRRLLERMSNIYKILQETFQGIRVVKAFTMEPRERRRFHDATRDYYHKAMLVVNLDALSSPVVEVLGVMAISGALLVGAYLVLDGQTHLLKMRMIDQRLTSQQLVTLYVLLAAIADPVRRLSSVYTRLQSGGAAADRIFACFDRQPRVLRNSDGYRLQRHAAEIDFKGVCFSYDPGRPVLTNIDLRVRFGETIAVVGKNGSGKTTLLGLLPRFYDPDHGSILIDGHDIRHAQLRSVRQQVGVVTQETVLFDDTIFNNLTYGCRSATREQVEAAARDAYAHEFIMKLPRDYDTPIGEAGAKLSGGQRQRLALARAILRNPSILILDEFTSQYDAESEALIHRALKEFMRDRTTFVITHRLNTLEIAHRIVVLEAGRVIAVGTHAELLATCPVYQRLHEAQFQRLVA